MSQYVLVLDFGSQYTQLIARRVRELGVFSEIKPCHTKISTIDLNKIGAIILSGGPASVNDADAPEFDPVWLKTQKPILGICYGMQLITQLFGGKLESGQSREYGLADLKIEKNSEIFKSFQTGETINVWMSHGDHVAQAPKGFNLLASSKGAPVAAIGNHTERIYAVQFHPEVAHTPRGIEILKEFIFGISELKPNWNSANFIEHSIEQIREQAKDGQVICALSGGVDSTVAAVLVSRAIGSRLHCIFVDNGLLRASEAENVVKRLSGLGLNLEKVDATDRFLSALSNVTDPEEKRKIIGKTFIDVFEEALKRIPDATHLVQGTLYPDVVESVSVRGGPSVTIKSHHNVGGLPEKMKFKLIEPFRELFKDEVRAVGKALEVPDEIINRQPFPGPGLAVRIIGEITAERLEILRQADQIFTDQIKAAGLYNEIWQSFAVLLPVKSVGVMGDCRTYELTVALRAVTSQDGMTADWYPLPYDLLKTVSSRIINQVKGVNRVVYDVSSKPPATIEWE